MILCQVIENVAMIPFPASGQPARKPGNEVLSHHTHAINTYCLTLLAKQTQVCYNQKSYAYNTKVVLLSYYL